MNAKSHWENVYAAKPLEQVSWYQPHAEVSLDIIARSNIARDAEIIDVGGGASTLVDDLIARGFKNLTVLDIAPTALHRAKERLGEQANVVTWLEADITQVNLPCHFYDLWHDRAVFHFLTSPEQRKRYINTVKQALKPGAHLVVATFGPAGPTRCSGLEIVRYSPQDLHNEFGESFQLTESHNETHLTPSGTHQEFVYCWFRME